MREREVRRDADATDEFFLHCSRENTCDAASFPGVFALLKRYSRERVELAVDDHVRISRGGRKLRSGAGWLAGRPLSLYMAVTLPRGSRRRRPLGEQERSD